MLHELLKGSYTLCVSTEILKEYEEIIGQKLGNTVADNILAMIDNLPNVEYITTYYKWGLIVQDYDDNKFVDCAIACNANYLVTQDKHFKILGRIKFPRVNVIDVHELKVVLGIKK